MIITKATNSDDYDITTQMEPNNNPLKTPADLGDVNKIFTMQYNACRRRLFTSQKKNPNVLLAGTVMDV